MKPEHLVALGVRLFALGLAIFTLENAIRIFAFFKTGQFNFGEIAYTGTMISLALLSLLLWKFPLVVARSIAEFPSLNENELNDIKSDRLLHVGLIILGIYLLFNIFSDLIYWGIFSFSSQRDYSSEVVLTLEQKSLLLTTMIEFVLVLFLILGSNKIISIIKKLRYGSDK